MSLNQSRLPVSEAELSPQNVFSICMFTSIKSQFFSNTFSTCSSISSSRDRNKHLSLYGSVARIRDIDRKCPAQYHRVVDTADDNLCSGVDLL